ncbi:MAG: MBL fold metallo-hydrolase [Ruminococcaceae bacterium]|nr:MBL fold metallo-hydrolase [Oscillospiraceae bacterium]
MKRKTVLHQIKTKGITLDGMSYVIQAEDGSLIVIDGGMNEDADDLFAYLQRLCGGDKVTVDLWIITHAHADHYNCFMQMAESYCEKLKVKKLMYDFQPKSFFEIVQPKVLPELERLERVKELLKGMEVVTPRRGEKYSFGESSIHILFTASDLPPLDTAPIPQETNDGSLVFRLNAEGQTVLFLGDVMEAGDAVLTELYGDKLKSDLCQIAHHGARASTCEFYDLVDPDILLWPVGLKKFDFCARYIKASHYLLSELHVKDVILAGHGTRRLELPVRPSVAPFLPEVPPAIRSEKVQLTVNEASRRPDISDPSDGVWLEAEEVSLSPAESYDKGIGRVRLLWREDALYFNFSVKCSLYPSDPDCIKTASTNNLRLAMSEGLFFQRFMPWKDCPKERIIDNLKFFAEKKSALSGDGFCSDDKRCRYKVLRDGESFSVCAEIPFNFPRKRGDMIGLNLEFNAVGEDKKTRRIREELQRGELALRCEGYPAALCYVKLN